MALKKRARIGQGANAALGVAVDPLFEEAGEHPRGEDNPLTATLPDSTIPAQATPVPTPTEGATVPPPDILIPPLASASGSDMNYGKMVAFSQATEDRKLKNMREQEGTSKARSAGNFEESFSGGRSAFRGGSSGPTQSHAQSSASALPAGHSQQQGSRFKPNQGQQGTHHHGRSGGRGHIQKECRSSCQGAGRGIAQPSSSVAATSSAPPPA
uniref:Ena/VASP-like protein n=1 Tax=Nicotiana tabacum TaxID=4097 RepID=A0A1S3ZDE7_TOBAC|nr:PREDICTED: ena/VASP-like protein [Nicotiana tabacum]